MNSKPSVKKPRGEAIGKEVTAFGVMWDYGGCELDELDSETLQTMGKIMEEQDLYPERYELRMREETPEQIMARVKRVRKARAEAKP